MTSKCPRSWNHIIKILNHHSWTRILSAKHDEPPVSITNSFTSPSRTPPGPVKAPVPRVHRSPVVHRNDCRDATWGPGALRGGVPVAGRVHSQGDVVSARATRRWAQIYWEKICTWTGFFHGFWRPFFFMMTWTWQLDNGYLVGDEKGLMPDDLDLVDNGYLVGQSIVINSGWWQSIMVDW